MSIQGLNNNSFFNLNNIRTLAGGSSSTGSTGGSFSLGNAGGSSSSGATGGDFSAGGADTSSIGGNGVDLGNVSNQDPNVQSALDSVAGESAIQAQFRNQLALVNLQDRIQTQSRTVEILTNILKSRHDAALSAARNVK